MLRRHLSTLFWVDWKLPLIYSMNGVGIQEIALRANLDWSCWEFCCFGVLAFLYWISGNFFPVFRFVYFLVRVDSLATWKYWLVLFLWGIFRVIALLEVYRCVIFLFVGLSVCVMCRVCSVSTIQLYLSSFGLLNKFLFF